MNPTDFFTAPPEQGPVGRSPQRYLLTDEVSGGYDSPEAEWPAIAESAVEAMATLFQFLEPNLNQ